MPLSNNGAASRKPLNSLSNVGVERRGPTGIPKPKTAQQKRLAASTAASAKARAAAGALPGAPTAIQRRKTIAERSNENAQNRRVTGARPRTARSGLSFTARPDDRTAGGRWGTRFREEDFRDQDVEAIVAAQVEKLRIGEQLSSNEKINESIKALKNTILMSKDREAVRAVELAAKLSEMEGKLSQSEAAASEKNLALNELSIEIAKKEHGLEVTRADLKSELKAKGVRIEILEKDLKTVNTTIAALEIDKKFVDKVVCEKDEEIARLQRQYAEHGTTNEHLKISVEDTNAALQRAITAKTTVEKQLDDVNASLRGLQQTVCDHEMDMVKKDGLIQKMNAQHDASSAELARLKTTIDEERETTAKLRASLTKAQNEAEDASARHNLESANLKRDSEDFREKTAQKLRTLEEAKANAEASQRNTSVELEGARADVAQFRSTVSSQEGAVNALKSQVAAVEVKLKAQSDISLERSNEIVAFKATIEKQMQEIGKLEGQAHLDEDERRKLHNALQELKGNIRVFCRVRPVLSSEAKMVSGTAADGSVFQYHTKSRGISAVMPGLDAGSSMDGQPGSSNAKNYTFDRVFGPTSTQEDVFGEISQLVQSALDGYRVCIFAYGQTGSGKTHTIMGNESDLGMIPRSVEQIFERAERLKKDQWKFQFQACFLEIYNEKIRDLLVRTSKPAAASSRGQKKDDHEVTFDRTENKTNIEGLTVAQVTKPEDATRLIATATRNRSTAATLSNAESSRSHSVFRLYITGNNATSGQTLSGVLNLVDLAGSERVKVSGAEGERLKESKAINKSLSQLSTVIQSLANRDKHIPYRSSKLTRVLQDSLGGDSKTLMFVNVAPVPTSYNESICSLRFAEQVNACEIGIAKRSTKIDLTTDLSL